MVCTGTYVHSGDVITIGQALPTLRGQETSLRGRGEMIGFMNPGILVKYHKKHYSAWIEAFESKRGFHLLPCFRFQFEQLWVDSALIDVMGKV